MTRKKDIRVKPSNRKDAINESNYCKNRYQRVFHVLCITCASFDPNQHQPFGHLKVKEEMENLFKTLRRADATCLYACVTF